MLICYTLITEYFYVVQEVFHERVKVFQAWQYSQTMLAKKRDNKAKLELSARQEKVAQAQQEVQEVSLFLFAWYNTLFKFCDHLPQWVLPCIFFINWWYWYCLYRNCTIN